MQTACLLFCLAAAGCASTRHGGMREEFEQSAKGYNKMLRWHEIEAAGMAYLRSDLRDAFLKASAEFKRRGVTITDYRILTTECFPEKKSGDVLAEFEYYILPSNRIKTQAFRQTWEYQDESGWRQTSPLPPFE